MILYKHWLDEETRSIQIKHTVDTYIHLKKIQNVARFYYFFLPKFTSRYLFLLQKKRYKVRSRHHVQKCICNATPSTRKPPSLSPSLWSNGNSVEDSPPVATKHRAKQQITGIICGAYDSSRRIYVKWNPLSGSVEGRLVSCVSDFPTVSTDHFWNLCGGGCHVRVSYCWRWPSGALSSLSCAHAWGVGVLVWEKGWESIRLNVCDDEINLTVCKRLSETGDAVRVYVVCGVILQSFSQPPYWKYRRTGRSRVPYPGCFWRCPPRSCVPFRNSSDETGDGVLICCMTLMARTL